MITRDKRTAIITREMITSSMVKIEMAAAVGTQDMLEELMALKEELVRSEDSTLVVDAHIQYLRMCVQEMK